jgi:hypothetical protein
LIDYEKISIIFNRNVYGINEFWQGHQDPCFDDYSANALRELREQNQKQYPLRKGRQVD